MSSARLVLKILSGTYAGAELALAGSSYVMGRSLDCDISVEDDQLADETLRLQVVASDNIAIEVLSYDKKIGVNGLQKNQSSFIIQLYDCLQVEHFMCAIGAEGAAWPVYPPATDLINQEQEAVADYEDELNPNDEASAEQIDEINMDKWADDEQEELTEELPSQQPKEQVAELKGSASSLLNKIIERRRVIAAIGSVITLVSSSLVFTVRGGKEVTALMSTPSQTAPVAPRTATTPISSPIVGAISPPVNTAAQTESQNKVLVSSVKDMLDTFGFSTLTVAPGTESGEVIITGYAEDVNRWSSVAKMVQRDIPLVIKLTDQVETPKQRKEKLEKIIARHGLTDFVHLFITNKGLVAKTSFSADDEKKWALIEQEYADFSHNQPALFKVRDNANWLDIKSVSFGYESYVITADGNRYMVGSVMKNGYTLEKIAPEGLVLRNSEGIVRYPLP